MENKIFDAKIAGLTLPFKFYTFDSIKDDLKKVFEDRVKEYDMSIYRKWSQIRRGKVAETKFFTYIKFFIDKETKKPYGLIGGKTNYDNPDIRLYDVKENEHRFGRLFIKNGKYEMSNKILVVHHKLADEDNKQALFIEKYVQRKYNLFDS